MILQMIVQAAQRGMSPQQFFQQYGQDPRIAPVAKIAQGKSRDQLMQTVSNMAAERGTSVEELSRQMGIPIPQ